MVRPRAALFFVSALLATVALGQQGYPPTSPPAQTRTPSDIELKTAYCIKITEHLLRALTNLPPPLTAEEKTLIDNQVRAVRDQLNRFEAYLAPKLSEKDSLALLGGAAKRAETDIATQSRSNLPQKCETECIAEGRDYHTPCVAECLDRDEVYKRVRSCSNVNWLPF
jgi:hypothetical protein